MKIIFTCLLLGHSALALALDVGAYRTEKSENEPYGGCEVQIHPVEETIVIQVHIKKGPFAKPLPEKVYNPVISLPKELYAKMFTEPFAYEGKYDKWNLHTELQVDGVRRVFFARESAEAYFALRFWISDNQISLMDRTYEEKWNFFFGWDNTYEKRCEKFEKTTLLRTN